MFYFADCWGFSGCLNLSISSVAFISYSATEFVCFFENMLKIFSFIYKALGDIFARKFVGDFNFYSSSSLLTCL